MLLLLVCDSIMQFIEAELNLKSHIISFVFYDLLDEVHERSLYVAVWLHQNYM